VASLHGQDVASLLSPFALYVAFPRADYYGDSATMGASVDTAPILGKE